VPPDVSFDLDLRLGRRLAAGLFLGRRRDRFALVRVKRIERSRHVSAKRLLAGKPWEVGRVVADKDRRLEVIVRVPLVSHDVGEQAHWPKPLHHDCWRVAQQLSGRDLVHGQLHVLVLLGAPVDAGWPVLRYAAAPGVLDHRVAPIISGHLRLQTADVRADVDAAGPVRVLDPARLKRTLAELRAVDADW
jgi:hypothetical protein